MMELAGRKEEAPIPITNITWFDGKMKLKTNRASRITLTLKMPIAKKYTLRPRFMYVTFNSKVNIKTSHVEMLASVNETSPTWRPSQLESWQRKKLATCNIFLLNWPWDIQNELNTLISIKNGQFMMINANFIVFEYALTSLTSWNFLNNCMEERLNLWLYLYQTMNNRQSRSEQF